MTIRVPVLVVMSVTRHAVYALRSIEARSCNRCYSGGGKKKSISVTYSEFVFVAFDIQHALRMRHLVACGLSGSAVFFHIISCNGEIFGKSLLNTKCVFLFSVPLLSGTILIIRIIHRHTGVLINP